MTGDLAAPEAVLADGSGPIPVEIELKLEVRDVRAARRLLDGQRLGEDLVATGPAQTVVVVDRYVDTAARSLERAGRVARLRAAGDELLVTVKSLATPVAGAVHRREELEAPASAALEPLAWPTSDARALILELAGDSPLEELVTIRQQRRQRRFARDDTTIELSLDRVAILHNGSLLGRFIELEAELIAGDPGRLLALGELLAVDPAVGPARWSKFERAMAAVTRKRREAERPHLSVGKSPGVTPTDTLAEAGRKVMAFHFERLLAREAGTREGVDPEQLHQMRVATRRLRAAWRTFGDSFDPRRSRRLRRPLRRIATRLGAVRDLDVLLAGILDYRATLPDDVAPGLSPLLADLEAQREAARLDLAEALDEPRYGRWLRASVAFLSTPGAGALRVQPGAPQHVRELAPARIWAAYGHVRAFEPIVAWADVQTLHALRIEGKRLRYALEFVRDALGPGTEAAVVKIVALQDHLGALHDADVAGSVAREFLGRHAAALDPTERQAIGGYIRSRDAELRRLRRSVGRPWRGVNGIVFRRRLGALLAAL